MYCSSEELVWLVSGYFELENYVIGTIELRYGAKIEWTISLERDSRARGIQLKPNTLSESGRRQLRQPGGG